MTNRNLRILFLVFFLNTLILFRQVNAQARADTLLIGSSIDSAMKLYQCRYSSVDSISYLLTMQNKIVHLDDLSLNLEGQYSEITLEMIKLDKRTDGILLKQHFSKTHSVGAGSWGLETRRVQIINLSSTQKIFDTYSYYNYQSTEFEERHFFNFCYCSEGLVKIEEIESTRPLPTENIDDYDDPVIRNIAKTGTGTFIFKNGTFVKEY